MNPTDEMEWTDRVVLVIGGDPVGKAIADGFRRQGADVASIVNDSAMTDMAAIADQVEDIVRQHGKIDVMVHAWEFFAASPAVDMHWQQWKDVIHWNVKSKFLFSKEVGKHMLLRQQGSIVLLTSIGGMVAMPGAVAFAASQGAIHQITRTLGVEWARRGVRVNAIASSLPEGSLRAERIAQVTPLGRLPEPKELVGTALYLASDTSQMVTGQIISVDGGYVTQ